MNTPIERLTNFNVNNELLAKVLLAKREYFNLTPKISCKCKNKIAIGISHTVYPTKIK